MIYEEKEVLWLFFYDWIYNAYQTYICITVICMLEVGGRDSILWSPFHLHLFVVAEYPWQFTTETEKNLEKWLYLPSYFDPPNVYKLIGMLHWWKKYGSIVIVQTQEII